MASSNAVPGRVWVARAIAVVLLAASLAMIAFSFASLVLPGTEKLPDRPSTLNFLAASAALFAFPLVGTIVTVLRPANPIGWLFIVLGISITVGIFSNEYVGRAVYTGAALPGIAPVEWVAEWSFAVTVGFAFVWIPLLFPTGHLPGRGWRPVAWAAAVVMLLGVAAEALAPGQLTGFPGLPPKPLAAPAELADALGLGVTLYFPAIVILGVLAMASLAVRFRRGDAVERQQLKWFLFATGSFIVAIVAGLLTTVEVLFYLALVAAAAIPTSAAIAILRYRLWDIDRLISRSLSWALITVVLVAVFAGGVIAMQAALIGFTQGQTLAVAASTLVAAALFQPLRSRVQRGVDRRFDRSSVNRERTAAAFAERLRNEVSMDRVASDLTATIDVAIRPATQGLWLRQESR
jgi:hypothetical protein